MTSTERHNARYMLAVLIAYDAIRREKHRLLYMGYGEAQCLCKEIVLKSIQPFIVSNDVADVHISIEQAFSNSYALNINVQLVPTTYIEHTFRLEGIE